MTLAQNLRQHSKSATSITQDGHLVEEYQMTGFIRHAFTDARHYIFQPADDACIENSIFEYIHIL